MSLPLLLTGTESELWLEFKLTSLLYENICHQMAMETITLGGLILYSYCQSLQGPCTVKSALVKQFT